MCILTDRVNNKSASYPDGGCGRTWYFLKLRDHELKDAKVRLNHPNLQFVAVAEHISLCTPLLGITLFQASSNMKYEPGLVRNYKDYSSLAALC